MVKVYVEIVLEYVVQPLTDTVFEGTGSFNKIQLLHTNPNAQEWLEENVSNFVRLTDWPLGSSDLNPRDYDPWDYLEQNACSKYHPNLESLKQSIEQEAVKIALGRIHMVIAQWVECSVKGIVTQVGHFE